MKVTVDVSLFHGGEGAPCANFLFGTGRWDEWEEPADVSTSTLLQHSIPPRIGPPRAGRRHILPDASSAASLAAMASSKDSKLLKQTKFPPEFAQKVDMTKVNIEVMKKCVSSLSLRSWG